MKESKTITEEEKVFMAETGERLRAVRQELELTLDAMYKKTGISGSYISDFERGKKFPSSKYLKKLSLMFEVSLDYIIIGKGEMFIRKKSLIPDVIDFGNYAGDIGEMLIYMKKIPGLMFHMLGYFHDYKAEKKRMIDQFNIDLEVPKRE